MSNTFVKKKNYELIISTCTRNGNTIEDEHHFRHAVKNLQYCFHFSNTKTKCIQSNHSKDVCLDIIFVISSISLVIVGKL
jgi:hypothetical protein